MNNFTKSWLSNIKNVKNGLFFNPNLICEGIIVIVIKIYIFKNISIKKNPNPSDSEPKQIFMNKVKKFIHDEVDCLQI